jgi:hypothetical protein
MQGTEQIPERPSGRDLLPSDFSRHSLTALLGGSELRSLTPVSCTPATVPVLARISNTKTKSCSIQHRHLPPFPASDSLKERFVKAKSSMVASSLPDDLCCLGEKIMEGIATGMGRID